MINFSFALTMQYNQFCSLLKERVCALVIKLFSPNVKCQFRGAAAAHQQQTSTPMDKPYFPVSMRLLRLVSVLIQKYYSLLVRFIVSIIVIHCIARGRIFIMNYYCFIGDRM